MNNYHTRQKSKIFNIIKNKRNEFTVKDIYNELNKEVGLTTIYRYIDKLINDGIVNQSIGKDNITYYQYLEECDKENHFYLKCEVCGNLIHVDCDCVKDLSEHIINEHKFKPSRDHFIINGICNNCSKGEI